MRPLALIGAMLLCFLTILTSKANAQAWQWLSNTPQTLYTNSGIINNVTLPYYDNQFPGYPHINSNVLSPDDGWTLLIKDFGNPGRNVSLPYFALYNQITSQLKLFVYNPVPSTYSAVSVDLGATSSQVGGQIPNILSFYTKDLSNSMSDTLGVTAISKSSYQQWIYAEFFITNYIPTISSSQYKNSFMKFKLTGIVESDISLNGQVGLSSVYRAGTTSFLSSSSGMLNKIQPNIDRSFKIYSTFADTSELNRSKNRGLKGIIGMAISQFIPALSGYMGLIDGFIGGTSAASLIGYKGTVNIRGNLITKTSIGEIKIAIPGTQNTLGQGIPFRNLPLGILNIPKPSVALDLIGQSCSFLEDYVEYCLNQYSASINNPNFVLNPSIEQDFWNFEFRKIQVTGDRYVGDVNGWNKNYWVNQINAPYFCTTETRSDIGEISNGCGHVKLYYEFGFNDSYGIPGFINTINIVEVSPYVSSPGFNRILGDIILDDNSVKIYPSVTNSSVRISYLPNLSYDLLDILGRRLTAGRLNSEGYSEININSIESSNGLHFVRFSDGNSGRFIIRR